MQDQSPKPETRPLTGPAAGPADAGAVQWLAVMLHGVGADGNDLIGLAPLFGRVVPDARFIAPDGPEACDMAPFGRQWFSLQDRSEGALIAEVERVHADVDAFLDAELGRLGLADDRLILAGFSQGAMTALHVGLRRPRPPAAILSFSGALVAPERLAPEITSRPPVLLVHGSDDEIVPSALAGMAERALKDAGVPVEAHLVDGLGHGIDDTALALAARFLDRIVTDT